MTSAYAKSSYYFSFSSILDYSCYDVRLFQATSNLTDHVTMIDAVGSGAAAAAAGGVVMSGANMAPPMPRASSDHHRHLPRQSATTTAVSMAYLGPVLMSVGCFAVIASVVVVCEVRDRMLDLFDKLGGLCTIGRSRRLRRFTGIRRGFGKFRARRELSLFDRMTSTMDDGVPPFRRNLLAFIATPTPFAACAAFDKFCRQATSATNETCFSAADADDSLLASRSAEAEPTIGEPEIELEKSGNALPSMDVVSETKTTKSALEAVALLCDVQLNNVTVAEEVETNACNMSRPFSSYDNGVTRTDDRHIGAMSSRFVVDSKPLFSSASPFTSCVLSEPNLMPPAFNYVMSDFGVTSSSEKSHSASIAVPEDVKEAASLSACAINNDIKLGLDVYSTQLSASDNVDSPSMSPSSSYRDRITSESDLSTVHEAEFEMTSSSSSSSFDNGNDSYQHGNVQSANTVSIQICHPFSDRLLAAENDGPSESIGSVMADGLSEFSVDRSALSNTVGANSAATAASCLFASASEQNIDSSNVEDANKKSSHEDLRENQDASSTTTMPKMQRTAADVGSIRSLDSFGQDSSETGISSNVKPRRLSHQYTPSSRCQRPVHRDYPQSDASSGLTPANRSIAVAESRVASVRSIFGGLSSQLSADASKWLPPPAPSTHWPQASPARTARRQPVKMSLPPVSHSAVAIEDVKGSLSSLRRSRGHVASGGSSSLAEEPDN
jgi:hypothetical protein